MLKHVFVSNGSALWCVQRLLQNSYFNLQDLNLSATEKPNLKEKLRTVSLYLYREKKLQTDQQKSCPIHHFAHCPNMPCFTSQNFSFLLGRLLYSTKIGNNGTRATFGGKERAGGGGVKKVYYGQRKNGKYHSNRI